MADRRGVLPRGRERGNRAVRLAALASIAALVQGCAIFEHAEPTIITAGETPNLIPEVPYVFSANEVVEAMLVLAGTGKNDMVFDLGCGDGRIPIAAAAKFGARGVGIDIDPLPLIRARRDAERAGVAGRVKFIRGNLFDADLGRATVVTLYLSNDVNRRLAPKLRSELAPGARIVSHKFDMGEGWPPERTLVVEGSTLYLWTVPAR